MRRIITASILLPLVVWAILFCSTHTVELISGGIIILASIEWSNIICVARDISITPEVRKSAWHIYQIWHYVRRALAVAVIVSLAILVKIYSGYYVFGMNVATVILNLAVVWWLLSCWMLVWYARSGASWSKGITENINSRFNCTALRTVVNYLVGLAIGCLLFIPTWLAITKLHARDPRLLLFACSLIWTGDIAAYYCGRTWGKRKLLPAVSPGKTWAGVYGAVGGGVLAVSLINTFWSPMPSITFTLALSAITIVFGVVGDLVESMFKRIRGIKDSGSLLPGHGGVLDRIDGLLAGVPIFAAGIYLGSAFGG